METSDSWQDQNLDLSTWSAEDFRARTSASQANVPELLVLSQVFGLSSPVLLAQLDLDGCSWRTFQVCLFPATGTQQECPEYCQTWPASGMWGYGSAWELQMSGPRTAGCEYSSWPTPTATDYEGSDSERAEQLWQTRTADPFRSCSGIRQAKAVTCNVKNWPTPIADPSSYASEGYGPNIRQVAERIFPYLHSLRDLTISTGQISSPRDRTSRRRLNPRFVEWLMGFPIGWTEP